MKLNVLPKITIFNKIAVFHDRNLLGICKQIEYCSTIVYIVYCLKHHSVCTEYVVYMLWTDGLLKKERKINCIVLYFIVSIILVMMMNRLNKTKPHIVHISVVMSIVVLSICLHLSPPVNSVVCLKYSFLCFSSRLHLDILLLLWKEVSINVPNH